MILNPWVRHCTPKNATFDLNPTYGVVFLGLKKAFDTVDHKVLIQKLRKYGFGHEAILWFTGYLTGRTQISMVNGVKSNACNVTGGVRRDLS